MRLKISILSILLFGLQASASVSFVNNALGKKNNEYIEEQNKFKKINIVTKDSPLKKLKEPDDRVIFWKDLEERHASVVKEYAETFAYNKITGFSNGIIDVTYQVRKGVKMAIKETFGGYAEYQRRKQVEEIVNTTFQNRKIIGDLFIRNNNERIEASEETHKRFFGFDIENRRVYGYNLIRAIAKNQALRDTRGIIKEVSFLVLAVLLCIKVLFAIKNGVGIAETFTKPVIVLIVSMLGIAMGNKFLSVNINLLNRLACSFSLMLSDFDAGNLTLPMDTWTDFAGSQGYFPTLMLSFFDMLSQIFIGFFYIALIAFIVFGMVFYPFWIVFSIFNPSKFVLADSYIAWLKANLVLVFSPILIIIFRIISKELGEDYMFMSILAKTLSFYSTPLLMCFILLKTKPTFSSDYEKIDYSGQLKEEIKDLLSIKNA